MHGVDVSIPASGQVGHRADPAFACLPPKPTRGMVVIHELLGRQPEIDRVVERFAEQGYATVAPDLFAHGLRVLCIRRMLQTIASGEGPACDQALRARDWLCEQAGVDVGSVGIIGFCLGGGFALGIGKHWGAVSSNYGDVPSTAVLKGIGPTIACYGGRDRVYGNNGNKLKRRFAELDVPLAVHDFPQVGHSFLTDGNHRVAYALTKPLFHIGYNSQVAEQAWRHIFEFFATHLVEQGTDEPAEQRLK